MILEQYLQKLGLSDKEAKLYLTGLQLGPATIQELANNSAIKRSTVYELIESLRNKNLVTQTQRNKKKFYVAQEPEDLLLFLRQKEKVLEQILPDLEALKNTGTRKPAIRIFEGIKGVKQIYEDIIKKPGEILAMAAPKDKIALSILDYLRNDWEPRRIQSGIKMKRININNKQGKVKDYEKVQVAKELEEVYYLPKENYPFSIGIYAYRNKVAFVSYHEREMVGIIIRSPEINWTVRMIFSMFWARKV